MAASEAKPEVAEEVRALAVILTDPEITKEKIEQRVVALRGDELPKVVIRARSVQGFAKDVIDSGETEMRLRAAAADKSAAVVLPGERWIDKGTGVMHRFEGELSDWKVADPVALRFALAKAVRPDGSRYLTDADIDRAVVPSYKPNHTVLNEFAKMGAAVREAVDDHREKTRGPAHLKEEKV